MSAPPFQGNFNLSLFILTSDVRFVARFHVQIDSVFRSGVIYACTFQRLDYITAVSDLSHLQRSLSMKCTRSLVMEAKVVINQIDIRMCTGYKR